MITAFEIIADRVPIFMSSCRYRRGRADRRNPETE
jgi:hypothetical protein